MENNEDGKKQTIIKDYEMDNKIEESNHEHEYPNRRSIDTEDIYLCCLCGEEHSYEDIHEIEIKGEKKSICKECADIVHGLL